MDVFFARQAIFDQSLSVWGYELLFRSGDTHRADHVNGSFATAHVLANTLLSSGGGDLLNGKPALVNFDERLLLDRVGIGLPADKVVIEILETVAATPEVLAACREYKNLGYRLALDDFVFQPGFEPLIELADIIKIDFQATSLQEQAAVLKKLKSNGRLLLAEKVETQEEFEWGRKSGYNLFQGYFFARPVIVKKNAIPSSRLSAIAILKELQQEDLDFLAMEKHIRHDVGLSYRLLSYVNSAKFATVSQGCSITSIGRALLLLGESELRRWMTIIAMSNLGRNKPDELVSQALIRARLMESLAKEIGRLDPSEAFLAGMFSLLDALLDRPLPDILREMRVERLLAIYGEDAVEPMAKVFQLVHCYERADWHRTDPLTRELSLEPSRVGDLYTEALGWVARSLRA